MKKILHYISIFAFVFLVACGSSEDPAPPHIAGSWELESFVIINLPSTHLESEGRTYQLSEISLGGASISTYKLDIAADGTYIRKVAFIGGAPSSNDQGKWTLSTDGEDFNLTELDADTGEDWSVVKNELDQLWVTIPTNFPLFSDAKRAELLAEHGSAEAVNTFLNGLTNEEFSMLLDVVTVDLLFAFARS